MENFLPKRDPRPLTMSVRDGLRPEALFIGAGPQALEVVTFTSSIQPSAPLLRELHAERLGHRAAPVVVIVLWGHDQAAVCGKAHDEVLVFPGVGRSQAERFCDAALEARDRHAAIRFLNHALVQFEAPIPGLRNSGLFAMNELRTGVRARADWAAAQVKARALLSTRGRDLVGRLGFTIEALAGPASLLVAKGREIAVAVFVERADDIEPVSAQFDGVSPISYALAQADRKNLEFVVVSAGTTVRVYPAKPGVGTGRRGRTETYLEINLDLLGENDAGYLWLLCSDEALIEKGSFAQILNKSEDYAADLGTRLRERVYHDVVPPLAKAIVAARRLRNPSEGKLAEAYQLTLLVLFRLLFVAYAEDKELLPLHTDLAYREHSLKHMAKRLLEAQRKGLTFTSEDFYWTAVKQLWKAVNKGNREWSVPEYDGRLFAADSKMGSLLSEITIPDAAFAPVLSALLIDESEDGQHGPIDFRSLGVREFGTIYEGLLESELSVAATDLAVDPKTQAYLPTNGKAKVEVKAGEVYLHNASGARKSSGAYYTKTFAVEHLLEHALEPALGDHLARLDALYDARDAAEQFFAFRVADIAMGSGHFLVAAIDHIERQFSNYLARRPLAGVTDELERLRGTAVTSLGPDWAGDPIEDTQLLRRQIARRCIFGVDLNPLAVELARLSIWIHTFVPGLPLSFLDGNLVVGNSLVGIATFEEATELIGAASGDLFAFSGAERLQKAREPMARLARLADATAAEVKEARKLYSEARASIKGEEALLTVLTASRIDETIQKAVADGQVATKLAEQGDVFSDALVRKAERALAGLTPLHFPIAFPQVFLSKRAGFDVILGNPPWEEATVEEDAFWARHFPGLRSLPQREQEARKATLRRERADLVGQYDEAAARAQRLRAALTSGPFPGMGTGDPDVYKAFCWRFWQLVARDGGRIGVVLPRSALAAKGSSDFRVNIFDYAAEIEITTLLNNKQWVFDGVHPQYTIGLVAIKRGVAEQVSVKLRGPYASLERFRGSAVREPVSFYGSDVTSWNDTASLPLLPAENSADVFAKLRRAPRLDLHDGTSWRARPQAELHATNDKPLMDLRSKDCPDGYWPVYKGESFDLWIPDTGTYYAWADAERLLPELHTKRQRSARKKDSAFAEFPSAWVERPQTLSCLYSRIAFRDITNRTNQRTVIAALVPPRVFLSNTAPYLLWPRGTEGDQAFLLGCLCSLPLDWYARRFVETHLNFFVLNPFPIPRPNPGDPLRLRVIDTAGRLATQDRRLVTWAKALSLKPRPLVEDEQDDLIAELDATVAHLYGLSEADLVHIFETFHQGWDYGDRLGATLKHYHHLKSLA